MQSYLVGGAVRDQLLGLPIRERDWVIVGATPEEMLAKSYKPVGKDFPVFLHPETHEEYALARTERKTGKGYKGFHFYASPEVSLEEDLARRDLTINAIAKASDGSLIDPYHGQEDLKRKILRHVSAAFQEDPVRILRIARFAAKFPDFNIHPDTLDLMKIMVVNGEVDALVSERVWQETARALAEVAPLRFFESLKNCGALEKLFPELNNLEGLAVASQRTQDPVIRWAVLLHALDAESIDTLSKRLRAPREYTELAVLVRRYLNDYRQLKLENSEAVLALLMNTDALRRHERFQQFLIACEITAPTQNQHSAQLQQALELIKKVDLSDLLERKLGGEAFAEALRAKRIAALTCPKLI